MADDRNSIIGDDMHGWGLPNKKDKFEVDKVDVEKTGIFRIDATSLMIGDGKKMTEDEYRHKKILDEMADTFSKKNSDYGNAFEEVLDDLGASYAVGRLKEKHKRLTKLVTSNKQEVDDESIEDTLLDMANYAVLTIMWLQKQKENK